MKWDIDEEIKTTTNKTNMVSDSGMGKELE